MSDENTLRRDVALANRIIERFGLSNAFGHASARIPGTNTFYISTRRSPGLADENKLLVIEPHRVVHNQGGVFLDGVPEYGGIGLIRSRELGDGVAKSLGKGVAVMMRGHGITTAFADVRAATVAACFLEESAGLQMRMLAAAGGDARKIRAFTREEADLANAQTGPGARADRAWEYYSTVAAQKPLGG